MTRERTKILKEIREIIRTTPAAKVAAVGFLAYVAGISAAIIDYNLLPREEVEIVRQEKELFGGDLKVQEILTANQTPILKGKRFTSSKLVINIKTPGTYLLECEDYVMHEYRGISGESWKYYVRKDDLPFTRIEEVNHGAYSSRPYYLDVARSTGDNNVERGAIRIN